MSNRWLDDDDDDVQPTTRGSRWADDDVEDFDPNRDYMTQVVERKENNMLDSTIRSLQAIDESERIGVATGEELVRQGEVLRRTEKRVDKMEQDLKESDRHIRSIKSIWGSFMNKFSKEPTPAAKVPDEPTTRSTPASSQLQNAMTTSDAAFDQRYSGSTHPVLERQEQSRQRYNPSASTESRANQSNTMSQVDQNLDMMGQGLSRLKGLALGMQSEMDSQDPIIERLADKTSRVDSKIHVTNKEMMKLNR